MSLSQNDINKLTRQQVAYLIRACEYFFPLIGSGNAAGRTEPPGFGIAELNAKWETPQEFLTDILPLTKTGSVFSAYQSLRSLEKTLASQPVEAPEQPSSTVLDKTQLQDLVEEYEKAKTEAQKEAALDKHGDTRFVKEYTRLKEIKAAQLKNKVVYAEPVTETPRVSLSETEIAAYEKLRGAALQAPQNFIETTATRIQGNLPESVAKSLSPEEANFSAKMVAADLAVRLRAQQPNIPPQVFASLAGDEALNYVSDNPELRSFFREAALFYGSIGAANEANVRSFLNPSLGNNFVNYLYGSEGGSFRFSNTPSDATAYTFDLDQFGESFRVFEGSDVFRLITEPATGRLKGEILSRGGLLFKDFLAGLPKESFLVRFTSSSLASEGFSLLSGFGAEYTATSTFGSLLKFAFPEYLPILHSLAGKLGLDIGISASGAIAAPVAGSGLAGVGAGTAGGVTVGAAGGTAGATAGTTAAIAGGAAGAGGGVAAGAGGAAAAGAAAGTPGGPIVIAIGALIGFIGGIIGGKALSWLQQKIKNNGGLMTTLLGAGLLGLGVITGAVPLAIAGALGIAIGVPLALGLPLAALIAQGATFTSGALFGLTGAAVSSIASVAVTSLVVFPIVVAIILFIINSGAYIVPPKTSLIAGLTTSPYIDVIKTVEGKSDFENSDLPAEVTYKIIVRAKKGTLSNVRFGYECEVVRDGQAPDCPRADIPAPPKIISPASGFSFTYSGRYDDKFSDSLIIDTFTVTADAPEAKGAEEAASASVRIGAPPEECPGPWPLATSLGLTQGANGPFTHKGAEAIDISSYAGTPITVTHTGIVTAYASNVGPYGKHVEVSSSCGGKEFFSRYAHLSVVSVKTGKKITLGEPVGLSGNTGNSTGAHLHYEFRYPSGPTSYPKNPPFMNPPYVPKTLPRNCSNGESSRVQCGSVPIP